jgi:hypothetical protein
MNDKAKLMWESFGDFSKAYEIGNEILCACGETL